MSNLEKPEDNENRHNDGRPGDSVTPGPRVATHITFGEQPHPSRRVTAQTPAIQRRRSFIPNNTGVAVHSSASHPRNAQPFIHEGDKQPGRQRSGSLVDGYLETIGGLVGRNSQFHRLSEKDRRILGGIEYDAICLLSWLVPAYFVLFQLIGAVGVGAWLQMNRPYLARENGQYAPILGKELTGLRSQPILDRRIFRGQRLQQLRHGSA